LLLVLVFVFDAAAPFLLKTAALAKRRLGGVEARGQEGGVVGWTLGINDASVLDTTVPVAYPSMEPAADASSQSV